MRKRVFVILAAVMSAFSLGAKTLVVYYSYTNNVHRIVSDLRTLIDADVVRIEPAEKGLRYEANNYAIGSALISAIRRNPDAASSYPAIDPVDVRMSDYDVVIVAAPLWWSQMAAPLQSFLFQYGRQMAGKSIGLIVSSASSGISGVVSDAKRLIPDGRFLSPDLWITSSQVSGCHSMLSEWLDRIGYSSIASGVSPTPACAGAQVCITSAGISVNGSFDRVSVYNAGGQKLLEAASEFTPYHFQPGCYVVQLRRGNTVSTVKQVAE